MTTCDIITCTNHHESVLEFVLERRETETEKMTNGHWTNWSLTMKSTHVISNNGKKTTTKRQLSERTVSINESIKKVSMNSTTGRREMLRKRVEKEEDMCNEYSS